jgi:phage baseplate assembly protein gpV
MARINGVVVGTVKDVNDPDGLGRVRVQFPWMGGRNQGYWAPVATPMAGGKRGVWFMPEQGDEVLVAFDHGSVHHPFIIGYCWNGKDKPPETDPHWRLFCSVQGHEIAVYDPPQEIDGDKGFIRIKDAHGNYIEWANDHVAIHSRGTVIIDAPNVVINGRAVGPAPKPI